MVFNSTFNDISVTPVFFGGGSRSHWQTVSHTVLPTTSSIGPTYYHLFELQSDLLFVTYLTLP
jgi:hypothetical protein